MKGRQHVWPFWGLFFKAIQKLLVFFSFFSQEIYFFISYWWQASESTSSKSTNNFAVTLTTWIRRLSAAFCYGLPGAGKMSSADKFVVTSLYLEGTCVCKHTCNIEWEGTTTTVCIINYAYILPYLRVWHTYICMYDICNFLNYFCFLFIPLECWSHHPPSFSQYCMCSITGMYICINIYLPHSHRQRLRWGSMESQLYLYWKCEEI